MELNLLDRIIILNSLLPETGTIDEIKLMISIKNKLQLTEEEMQLAKINHDSYNIMTVDFDDKSILLNYMNYDLTLEELSLLSNLADNVNKNGYVTVSSLNTVEKLINYTLDNNG